MGLCLSCLLSKDNSDEDILNESTPLLNENHENNYDKNAMIIKRQEQLNSIVNETNEKLIDINTFINSNSSNNYIPELSIKRIDELDNRLKDNDDGYNEEEEDYEDDDDLLKRIQNEVHIQITGPLIEQFE
ncbi:hypothetical protein WICMUC_000250 [Wickerhamomyces mucosus]|uniref:Uncharacterized protein n=1 Tax=Wickerhamomyces mucosus TaxID=1378264 RepID=A0A9P8PYB5_9ASCO|nr:hypothetical protein WICMUC_000250 [Wickerhamomyces mucosus]